MFESPYPEVGCSVDTEPKVVMHHLLAFKTVVIEGYCLYIDESAQRGFGHVLHAYSPKGRDEREYDINVASVQSILSGIRTGYFDPAFII